MADQQNDRNSGRPETGSGEGRQDVTGTTNVRPGDTKVWGDAAQRFRLMADAQLTGWSSLEAVDIYRHGGATLAHEPFNWEDTMFYSVGGEWDLSDAFTFRAGVGFDETPTNDAARTPRLPDNDRTLLSVGVTWHATDALSIDAAYQHISIKTPHIDAFTSLGTELSGKFSGHADLFGIAAQYRF